MGETVRELGGGDFAAAVARGVALVDFYGAYCPPCKLLEPVVAALAEKYGGRALFAKVNVDDNFDAAVDNGIEDIPTIVLFRDGAEEKRLFGAQSPETLEEELLKLLA